MKLEIRYDPATREITFGPLEGGGDWLLVQYRVLLQGRRIPRRGARYGVAVTADGVEVAREEWPRPGVELGPTDQELGEAIMAAWDAGVAEVRVMAWVEPPGAGLRLAAEHVIAIAGGAP